ncbi:methylenetetrahydrofolate reductase [Gloeocapsopsis crepidinum LEGE 06123]|uniref:Methylenetetrahydrofolate reductase n=1 Tax=Gloeocapsopsis crepidinum LEGE 06123 TaxID=588587 RepID=A0ABR9UYL9_9CHRO|nr:methylenetetrahydrofolate reductase [Gloeocapsopsis crepidinum]MBE9192353.1 methylenetetrahydrofolate reductase [Gloeocapsopsis crepidinum LEGE 06123]
MIAANRLQTLLNAGHFVVSAELTPPRHYKIKPLISKAEKIAAYVDVVHINDNALSQARLSNVVAAHLIQQIGIEPVVQLTLRHKNRIALQSDLLGLAALGIRNVMILGGYPCSIGSDPDAKEVNDISAIDAIAATHNLTTYGKMFNGDAIAPAPDFYIGTIAVPYTAPDKLDESMALLAAKINCGARYIQLQATFDLTTMQQWMAEVVKRGWHKRVHFIGAVFPFSSWKGLEFLQTIPGFNIPNDVIERIRSSDRKSESLQVTLELIQGIQAIEGIRGIHLRLIGSSDCSQIVELAGLRQFAQRSTIT